MTYIFLHEIDNARIIRHIFTYEMVQGIAIVRRFVYKMALESFIKCKYAHAIDNVGLSTASGQQAGGDAAGAAVSAQCKSASEKQPAPQAPRER